MTRRSDFELQEEAESRRMRRIVMIAVAAGSAVLIGLFFWLFEILVQPAPPRSVVISTGPADGAYHAFALRYRAHLARYGVDMVLKESKGSLENLERLQARRDGVQVALVQGGIASGRATRRRANPG